jgi:diguanylate cyclase (GGDEF)-like protein
MDDLMLKRKFIILGYILLVIGPTLILGLWTYAEARNNLYNNVKMNLEYVTEDTITDLKLYLNDFGSSLATMSQFSLIKEVQQDITKMDEVIDILHNFISYHPTVSYIYIGLEDGSFLYPTQSNMPVPADFDPTERNWYQQAKVKGTIIWTDIYYSVSEEAMITAAVPIYNNNNLIGVLAADFTLNNLAHRLGKQYVHQDQYLMVLDTNNNIIYHPQNHLIGHQVNGLSGQDGIIEFDLALIDQDQKGNAFAYYSMENELGIKVITYVLKSVLLSENVSILTRTGIVLTATLSLLSISFIFFFSMNKKYSVLKEVHLKLKKESNYDDLTGVYNRKYILELLNSSENNSDLTIMMLDIDHFKQINDKYGHQAGDEALRKVAQAIKGSLRSQDKVGRYGGEEFIILLPNTDIDKTYVIAERIRSNVEYIQYTNKDLKTTISIGVAMWQQNYNNMDDLIKEADRQLYRAKFSGRNQVQVSSLEG